MPTFETGREVDRVVFFSDAVFAIAMTLLAVQIRIPDVPSDQVASALRHQSREIVSYVITFWVIGVYWMAHHRMFRFIRRVDGAFIGLNLVLLAVVAFTPVPSELLGRTGSSSAATVFYAVTIMLMGLATLAVWVYATYDRRLVDPSLTHREVVAGVRRSASSVVVFGASIPLALVNPSWAEYCWLLLIPLRIVPARLDRRRAAAAGQ